MNITLRAGERFFINGAAIRIDRGRQSSSSTT
jgi:flagellar biosynthesis regulator FlbT